MCGTAADGSQFLSHDQVAEGVHASACRTTQHMAQQQSTPYPTNAASKTAACAAIS
jgi:hypothetical protein